MKRKEALTCLLVLIAGASICVAQQQTAQSPQEKAASFLIGAPQSIRAVVTPFNQIPNGARPITRNENDVLYDGVLAAVLWSIHQLIKPELLPSDSYIRENALLFKACKETSWADTVYLRYNIAGIEYLLAETGGTFGQLFLFMKVKTGKTLAEKGCDSRLVAQGLIGQHIMPVQAAKLAHPTLTTIQGFVSFDVPSASSDIHPALSCFASDNEACMVLFPSAFYVGIAPLVIPKDDWFAKAAKDEKVRRSIQRK